MPKKMIYPLLCVLLIGVAAVLGAPALYAQEDGPVAPAEGEDSNFGLFK